MPSPAITVYYDGLCPVCSREVALYRRLDRPGRIAWRALAVDEPAGSAPDPERRDFTLQQALTLLHVRDADGALRIGLEAHLLMWRQLPGFRLLAWATRRCPLLHWGLGHAYLAFTSRRPGLALRRRAAENAHA